ncbi:MAG: helicase-associated domain-containing protein [Candidatus Thorarchaeota archaeon]
MPKESLERELEHVLREDLLYACQYWDIEVTGKDSGASLIKMLAERMRDSETRERVFNSLSDIERDLLGMLTLNDGAMSYDRLKPFRKIYSYGQLNQTEKDLRKKGIIIRRMMSRVTEFGREVAEFKIIDYFMPHLTAFFSAKPESHPEKPKKTKTVVNERDSLLLDLLLLISYISKNEVRMTTSWEFPKRDIDNMKAAMSESTDERFEVVQKIGRKSGAYSIVEEDHVRPARADQLFVGSQYQVARKILLSSLGRTRAIWATPDQPTEYTLNLAICRLRESTPEEWISIQELRDWIRSELFEERQPLKWIQVSEERVQLSLETPLLLGIVEGAYRGKKLLGVRVTEVGAAVLRNQPPEDHPQQETFFVQPNFEITVFTSEMRYENLYRLMLITDPIRTDVVSTFKITDKSIFKAIEMGLRKDDILGFLKRESSKPIPKNVVRSIEDWVSQTTFAKLTSVILFETENERDLENLMILPEFKKHVVRQVGPTAVVVKGNIDQLTENLRNLKCMIETRPEDDNEQNSRSGTRPDYHEIFESEHTVEDVPEDCEGCPALMSCNRIIQKRRARSQHRR